MEIKASIEKLDLHDGDVLVVKLGDDYDKDVLTQFEHELRTVLKFVGWTDRKIGGSPAESWDFSGGHTPTCERGSRCLN